MEKIKTAIEQALDKLSPKDSSLQIIARDFEEIELTEEESKEALRLARERKYYQLENEKYWKQINTLMPRTRYTADELFTMLQVDGFEVTDWNQPILRYLCLYFSGDQRFEEQGYSLTKGILLVGSVGVGKTALMKWFSQNQIQSYRLKNCRQIEDEWVNYKPKNEDEIEREPIRKHSLPIQVAINANRFGHREIGLCFDDLGTEAPTSKRYGEEKQVMTDIILNRYSNGLAFDMTHITTNLDATQIEKIYGLRVRDRLRECLNWIAFDKEKSKSWRL